MVETASEGAPVTIEFQEYLADSLADALAYSQHYDGLCIAYAGKPKSALKPAELAEYQAEESVFIGAVTDWSSKHPGKRLDFVGNPHNLADKSILDKCNMIFLSASLDVTDVYAFNSVLADAQVDGVPLDRFGIVAAHRYRRQGRQDRHDE